VNEREIDAGLAATPGYRYADRFGEQLFVAGQVPKDGAGDLVAPDDPAGQATACLDNLGTLATVHGFGIGDIRQLVIYVVGEQQNLAQVWDAVVAWFGGEVPPATLLGVNRLGYVDQLVEVDATIVKLDED
jgi:enamine deaminase RidA (YjgF/YER057c/UK114 family)